MQSRRRCFWKPTPPLADLEFPSTRYPPNTQDYPFDPEELHARRPQAKVERRLRSR